MIKKILLGLGLSVVSFIGFSSSAWIVRQNGVYGYSPLDQSIDLQVNNKGQLMSQRFGNTQRMLAFASSENSRIYFWWSFNQKPYYFINYGGWKNQGYLKTYQLCDEIYLTGQNNISNCTTHNVTDNFAVEVGGLFQSMTIHDFWAYNVTPGNCYGTTYYTNKVCFSSSEYGKSICFFANLGRYIQGLCSCDYCDNLENSLGFDYDRDFTSINGAYLNTPPGFVANSTGNVVPSTSTSLGYCPTINQLLGTYGSSYSESLCYSSSLIYSGGSIVSVTPKTIFDVFGSGDVSVFRDFRELYSVNCHAPYTSEHCMSVFSGYSDEYSIVSKIPDDVKTANLYQYCRLQLLYPDKNTTTCVGSGVLNGYSGRTLDDVTKDLVDGDYGYAVPGSGSVTVNVFGDDTEYTGDVIDSLQQIYGKFTSFFTTQIGNSNGIIPGYIISALLVIILFRLFKK